MTDEEFELLQSTLHYDVLQDVVEHIAFYPAVSATAVVILASGIIVLLVTYFRNKLTKTKLSTKYYLSFRGIEDPRRLDLDRLKISHRESRPMHKRIFA